MDNSMDGYFLINQMRRKEADGYFDLDRRIFWVFFNLGYNLAEKMAERIIETKIRDRINLEYQLN